jgi:hypothetical protein
MLPTAEISAFCGVVRLAITASVLSVFCIGTANEYGLLTAVGGIEYASLDMGAEVTEYAGLGDG